MLRRVIHSVKRSPVLAPKRVDPLIRSISTAAGCVSFCTTFQYQLNYRDGYKSVPVLPVVPQVHPRILAVSSFQEHEPGGIVSAVKKISSQVIDTAVKSVKYARRILLYALLGLPMVGLLPATHLLGDHIPAVEEFSWNYMIWAIQTLGPCFIKMAQWASTRPDLFPPRLVGRLIRLQDDVEIHHSEATVHGTLAEAFGPDWQKHLEIDMNPLGAGSVAQVFKGTLKNTSKEVAVKMIHPHVEKLVRTDMELLSIFAWVIDQFPSLEILSLGETCRQFAEVMNRQLDLRVEAHNLEVFGKKFKDEKWAVFPQPVDGLVSKNILVETLLKGVPVNDYMTAKFQPGDSMDQLRTKLSDLGCRLVLKMIFFDNFIHGDLHPGNMLVDIQPNGEPRLVVLDCGIVYSSKSEDEFRHLVDICLAFMRHDGRAAARHMIAHAPENTVKHAEGFVEGIQGMVNSAEDQSYFEHIGEYVNRICELSRKHVVRLDAGYFRIAMALKVAEGMSLALNRYMQFSCFCYCRDLDLVSKCIPIILKAQALRAMGITQFPKPEDDPNRLKDNKVLMAEFERDQEKLYKEQEKLIKKEKEEYLARKRLTSHGAALTATQSK